MLPQRVQTLISEYSKPVSRPDWKTVCPLTIKRYYTDIARNKDKNNIFKNVYFYFKTN
jgi:hypothetical protein